MVFQYAIWLPIGNRAAGFNLARGDEERYETVRRMHEESVWLEAGR